MRNLKIISFCGLLLLGISCGVKKQGVASVGSQQQKEYVAYDMLVQTQQPPKQTVASALFELSQGGKGLKSKADIGIIADSCIQISVRPLLGIEVFRAGILPDGVILLDRLNGQYCKMGDRELSEYGGITSRQLFNLAQSSLTGVTVGWDFLPIRKGDMSNYTLTIDGTTLNVFTENGIAKGFKQVLKGGKLVESNYSSDAVGLELNAVIDTATNKEAVVPNKITVKGRNLRGKEQVKLEVYNYKPDRSPSINLQIPKSYRSKTLSELIESIK